MKIKKSRTQPRTNKLGFRCNDEEFEVIFKAASLDNLAPATYLRKLALDDAKAKGIKIV